MSLRHNFNLRAAQVVPHVKWGQLNIVMSNKFGVIRTKQFSFTTYPLTLKLREIGNKYLYYQVTKTFINKPVFLLKMEENKSQLEGIFDTICQNQGLSISQDNGNKKAQGPLYFLELETQDQMTRLLYADRVSTADFYDCGDQKHMTYSILSPYQNDHKSFLHAQESNLAKKILEELVPEEVQTTRHVVKIDLDDFSETSNFLTAHIENY